ncbi:MAG: AraC family transcriptional regulator [Phocaeicola sp.]
MNKEFNLNTIYTGFYSVEEWWNYQQLSSNFFRIYLITAGNCSITLPNEATYKLNKGDLFLVPKNIAVNYECNSKMEHYYICFIEEKIEHKSLLSQFQLKRKISAIDLDYELMERIVTICPQYKLPSVSPEIYESHHSIWSRDSLSDDFQTSMEQKAILYQLVSRFIGSEKQEENNSKEYLENKIEETLIYINKNIKSSLKIAHLAEISHLSPDYFTRVFKRIVGTTPLNYIQGVRLNHAKQLLTDSNLSIKEIAYEIGSENGNQFTNFFSTKIGLTPSKYRILKTKGKNKTG